MLKPDNKNRHQESQTDSILCDTLFVSKSELDNLRTELLFKLSGLYCGQTILKHWVLLLPVQILTMISGTE